MRCLLYGQTRKQRNKNINGTKINVQSPALYKLRQWMKTKCFIQAQWKSLWLKQQFMKSDQKCNCNVSNACLCLQRSVLIQPCDLRLITTENVDVKCAAFELVNMRSGKNCLRLDLLDCEDILLCCSGGTHLVFFGMSLCTWLTIQDSRHFSLSLQRCWWFCLRTEMKNLNKRRSSSLAGMFSIAVDSFNDSQNFFHAFKTLLVLY